MIIPWCNSAGLRRRELLNSNMDLDVSSLEQPDIKVGSFVSLQCNVRDKEGYFNWRSCIWRRSRDNKSCKRLYGCAGQFCFVGFGEYKKLIGSVTRSCRTLRSRKIILMIKRAQFAELKSQKLDSKTVENGFAVFKNARILYALLDHTKQLKGVLISKWILNCFKPQDKC
ncbi:unnamed protein product [Lepeophtheirus salmonis]|uniref:(salmon louse) hypothetical protein n=1 Tax=Lepeophtheirus salmonis TaxID=72036 RepID=A0A7R8H6L9_LEPSM|nr:unnamed protein product [Lepeophtheirus salmonis]CAF2901873.1 unnamed protein product [Lepeophtheirus salmonis]